VISLGAKIHAIDDSVRQNPSYINKCVDKIKGGDREPSSLLSSTTLFGEGAGFGGGGGGAFYDEEMFGGAGSGPE
jgi:hypothetical protein